MRRHLWWLPGLALVLVGGVIALTGGAGLGDAGPFAYDRPTTSSLEVITPSAGPPPTPLSLLVTRAQLTSTALALLGLATLAGGSGFRLGLRRAAQQQL